MDWMNKLGLESRKQSSLFRHGNPQVQILKANYVIKTEKHNKRNLITGKGAYNSLNSTKTSSFYKGGTPKAEENNSLTGILVKSYVNTAPEYDLFNYSINNDIDLNYPTQQQRGQTVPDENSLFLGDDKERFGIINRSFQSPILTPRSKVYYIYIYFRRVQYTARMPNL